ncbi:MAG TPA: amino acid permease [Bacillota bacterium]
MPGHGWLRRKSFDELDRSTKHGDLRRSLGWLDLTGLGIGAIIGTGIFVLTGVVAATRAGPAVVISFALSGLAAGLTALVYAELAAMVPVSGSAYTYAYAALGEIFAWVIGWDLILEYIVAASAVAIGWAGYAVDLLASLGITLPQAWTAPPALGGIINIPALAIVAMITGLLNLGTRESASVNRTIVAVKLAVILLFIAVGASRVRAANWTPFLPFGWNGVLGGAAIIFFAYIGFDAVSTAAEEVKRPQRDLPLGILLALGISTILYLVTSLVLTGMVPYTELNTPSPIAHALLLRGARWATAFVSVGALAGLTSVLLVQIYGQTRIFFTMARDGLFPAGLARLSARSQTPTFLTMLTGGVIALLAGLTPIAVVAELANIGTLAAFVIVSIGVIVLRRTAPQRPRPFRAPGMPWTALAAAGASLYLMSRLPTLTWIRFAVWLGLGLTIYALYGYRHSRAGGGAASLREAPPN